MNRKQQTLIVGTILITAVLVAAATVFFAATPNSDKVKIVATFYPLAYFSQEIGGENVQVTQLVPSNTEIHSWEPSASHISSAERADIIVYNGAGLDHWLEDEILPALSSAKTRVTVDTTAGLELIFEDTHEQEENTEHEHGLYDPHAWVSPYTARFQAEKIYEALVQKYPDQESYYTERWLSLKSRLEQLDNDYITQLSDKQNEMIFVSHEAFGYLAHRYGFEQNGVIGLSADEQPSAATIANLLSLMQEHETFVVYVDPVYSNEYALTLKNGLESQTGKSVKVLTLYLMLGQVDEKDLIQQMQSNLDNLKIGLEAT